VCVCVVCVTSVLNGHVLIFWSEVFRKQGALRLRTYPEFVVWLYNAHCVSQRHQDMLLSMRFLPGVIDYTHVSHEELPVAPIKDLMLVTLTLSETAY
jgi:hypothetical protein